MKTKNLKNETLKTKFNINHLDRVDQIIKSLKIIKSHLSNGRYIESSSEINGALEALKKLDDIKDWYQAVREENNLKEQGEND